MSRQAKSHGHGPPPRGVLLVGSVPLEDAEAVFRAVASVLGRHLRRIPDGETGARTNWISWQGEVFAACGDFEAVAPGPGESRPRVRYRLRDGTPARGPDFGPLGYADAARASYGVFAALRSEGVIPAGCRFQVCLPTPVAPVTAFVVRDDRAAVESAYEEALLGEVDAIAEAIPHPDLAIQWDVAMEFGFLEGVFTPWFEPTEREILTRLVRVGRRIPADVALGYHLCYGDPDHRHFVEPADTACLTRVANGINAHLRRNLDWIHLPVPRDRHDEEYFKPLVELACPEDCEVHLGLVHMTDGAAGTQRRIDTARDVLPFEFGVATECGFGRRPPETVAELLRIHAAVADPWDR